jgi:hypothetical protein
LIPAIGALALAGPAFAGDTVRDDVERLIVEIYRMVGLVRDFTPTTEPLVGTETVFVEPLAFLGSDLEIEWRLDGAVVAAVETSLDLETLRPTPGEHELVVTLRDPTDLVGDEAARDLWLTDTLTWVRRTLTATARSAGPTSSTCLTSGPSADTPSPGQLNTRYILDGTARPRSSIHQIGDRASLARHA